MRKGLTAWFLDFGELQAVPLRQQRNTSAVSGIRSEFRLPGVDV